MTLSWGRQTKLRKYLPFFFFAYGVFSVFSLQRDFSHITRLSVFLLLVGPSFMILALLGRLLERMADDSKWNRYSTWARRVNLSATQNMTQYILIFCFPFYVAKEEWIYFGINLIWMGTVLWDPYYRRLIHSAAYRHALLAWALVSASSFLFPFIFSDRLEWFYPALALASALAFIPTRKEKSYVLMLLCLWILSLIPLLLLDPAHRFPLLSVWAKNPHFAFSGDTKPAYAESLAKSMSRQSVKAIIADGASLCCVAPIVAPPGFRLNVRQEWQLGNRLIESVQLKTPIQGNAKQSAFHSYFCKRNFPFGEDDEKLRCRIMIGDSIDIGGSSMEVTK